MGCMHALLLAPDLVKHRVRAQPRGYLPLIMLKGHWSLGRDECFQTSGRVISQDLLLEDLRQGMLLVVDTTPGLPIRSSHSTEKE